MSPLQILHEQLSTSVIVITLIGQMDESNIDANAPAIYEYIEALPEGGALIMNFSGLEYMNSKSLGYTMDFFNKMNDKQGAFIIAEPQEQIKDILNVVGMSQVIPLVDSLSEARDMVLEEGAEPPVPPVNIHAPKEKMTDPTSQQVARSNQSTTADLPQVVNEDVAVNQNLTEDQGSMIQPPVKIDLQQESLHLKKDLPHNGVSTSQDAVSETMQAQVQDPEGVQQSPSETRIEPQETKIEDDSYTSPEAALETPVQQTPMPPVTPVSRHHDEEGFPILGVAAIITVVLIVLVLVLK